MENGKEKKNPRKSVPRELQTLTLLGDVQSQASGPAVERPCRARLPQPVGVSVGSAGRGLRCGDRKGDACGLGGKVPWGSISHSENDCSEDLTSFREV